MSRTRSYGSSTARRDPAAAASRTLADLCPGEVARVAALPPALHALLADFGVREGAEVRCESAAHHVVVRTPTGCVPLDRGLAAAVRVGSATCVEGPVAVT